MKQRPLFRGDVCVLCRGRRFGNHGRASHGLAHVRRNEAYYEIEGAYARSGPLRYAFFVNEPEREG